MSDPIVPVEVTDVETSTDTKKYSMRSRKPVVLSDGEELVTNFCKRIRRTNKSVGETNPSTTKVSRSRKEADAPLWIPPSVALSAIDRAPQLQLDKEQLCCDGYEGGYRMVRATHGVHRGAYYYEILVLPPLSDNAHVRVGWSTRRGELQAPVGYDEFSYGYRDIDGSQVHRSLRVDHYGESYRDGDVIGCYLKLVEEVSMNEIRFFKNGIDQGVAYSGEEIPSSVYFPAISLYMKARIVVNFGPSFIIKPDIEGIIAVSEQQPLSPQDRTIHEARIAEIKEQRKKLLLAREETTAEVKDEASMDVDSAKHG